LSGSHEGSNQNCDPNQAIAPNGNLLIKFMVVKNAQPMNKSCMNLLANDVVFDPNRIKKDALYKPLLRKFRSYLRHLID